MDTTLTTELDLFTPKKQELEILAVKYASLTIAGIDDKEGYENCRKARMELRTARTTIEKQRKAYTAEFDAKKKRAIEVENELIAIIDPIEEALHAKEKEIDAQKEAIRAKKEEEAQAVLNARVQELAAYGYTHDLFALRNMEEGAYSTLLTLKRLEFEEAEKQKKAAADEAEKARLAAEEENRKNREELEALRAKSRADDEEKARLQSIADDAAAKVASEEAAAADTARIDAIKKEAETNAERAARGRILIEQEVERQKAEEEQAKIEKKKKYRDWLAGHGVTEENKRDFDIRREGDTVKLYRLVDTFII